MIAFQRWTVKQLEEDVTELAQLWLKLQEYPTLFSDATRGDIRNWISLVKDPSTVWFLVYERELLVGLMYFQLLEDDADIHIVFFDRKPAEKRDLVKKVCQLMFDGVPQLMRISASIPELYHATCRLANKVGFHWEGAKRQAVVLNGRRFNVNLYGLLRSEAYGLHEESGEDRRLNNGLHGGRSGRSEDRRSSLGRGVST